MEIDIALRRYLEIRGCVSDVKWHDLAAKYASKIFGSRQM